MDVWNIVSYAAWAISAGLLLSMLVDTWRVSREYDESLLMSSREGEEN